MATDNNSTEFSLIRQFYIFAKAILVEALWAWLVAVTGLGLALGGFLIYICSLNIVCGGC